MMKKITSKLIPGIRSDYQFYFCRIDNSGHLEFGVEENFNEYITLKYSDENYQRLLESKLNEIQKVDVDFYNKVLELLNDTRETNSK